SLTTRTASLLGLAALVAAWVLLAPTGLGGSMSYAIVHGSSMEPRFHRGDLVLLRAADEYRVGDIAAYRSPDLGRTVMHRIVEQDGDRYVFKGDNNDFLDSSEPQRVSFEGKLWLRIPAVGGLLDRLRTPGNAAIGAALLALLLVAAAGGSTGSARNRRRRRSAPATQPVRASRARFGSTFGGVASRAHALRASGSETTVMRELRGRMARLDGETRQTILLACGGLLAACLVLGLWAFAQPSERSVTANGVYKHQGTFAYTARAPESPVYPKGRIATGQTVFTKIVDRVNVRFAYRLQSAAPRSIAGTSRLVATLQGDNGWERTVVLQPTRRFEGDRVRVSGVLDLRALQALSDQVERLTGTITDSYALSLSPEISLDGTIGGQPIRDTFAPSLALRLDSSKLRIDTASPAGDAATSLRRSESGSGTRLEPNRLTLLFVKVDVATARMLALLGGLLALLAGAAAALGRTGRGSDEPSLIAARYGSWLIDIAPRRRAGEAVLEVTTMDGLVRLAERYERMILHELHEGVHSYLVEEDGIVYRYRSGGSTEAAASERTPAVWAVGDEREAARR
ncbi:MAG: signal peptidase I, partial [Gaiellaceae bacterium]